MTFAYKTLGQAAPAAVTEVALYTVPALTSGIVEGVSVCNRSATPSTFRLSVSVGGGATADKDYVNYDTPVEGNSTVLVNGVITVAAGDVIRCQSGSGLVSFNAWGVEVS